MKHPLYIQKLWSGDKKTKMIVENFLVVKYGKMW
jgi:hypothetical protein